MPIRRPACALLAAVLVASPAAAAPRPVVVELFTSQACSSCPPAEALMRRLAARDPDLLVLDLHVTYWNGPAYRDPYALAAATARQNWYAHLDRAREVYTPQAVIDGRTVLVGSRAGAVRAAIAAARPDAAMAVPLRIARAGEAVAVTIGAGPAPAVPAQVLLVGYDSAHVTHIGGGENAGAVLAEADVVRALAPIGAWRGAPVTFRAPRPAGEHIAVLLQAADGRILGAARK